MSTITITGLTFQFDSDTVTSGTAREQGLQMIEAINESISSSDASPAIFGAHLLEDWQFVEECIDDGDTDVCDKCMMVKPACQIGRTDESGETICSDCEEEFTK